MWFAIGSKVALVSAGLTIMTLAANVAQLREQLTIDPVREYWDSEHTDIEVHVPMAASQAALPAIVQ